MSSLLGEVPESNGSKTLRAFGYFIVGIFFGIGPAFILYVVRFRASSPETAWHLPLLVWVLSALWTAHMGMTDRLQTPSRLFSLIVYGGYIYFAYTRSPEAAFRAGMNLFLPMLCIWFGSLMGGYTGYARSHPIDHTTPAPFVVFGGWLVLIGVPIITGFIRSTLQ
jgi:hypothetical protein